MKKAVLAAFFVSALLSLCPAQAYAFDVDGFKDGALKEDIRKLLSGRGNKVKESPGSDGLLLDTYGGDTKTSSYGFWFCKDSFVALQKGVEPTMKNFIFYYNEFVNKFGKPVNGAVKFKQGTKGEEEYRKIEFIWQDGKEQVSLAYIAGSGNIADSLSITYETANDCGY